MFQHDWFLSMKKILVGVAMEKPHPWEGNNTLPSQMETHAKFQPDWFLVG